MKTAKLLTGLLALTLVAGMVSATEVTRTFEILGENLVRVDISLDLDSEVQTYILTEQLPQDSLVTENGEGNYKERSHELKWLVIEGFEGWVVEDVIYSYTLQLTDPGLYVISGSFETLDGVIETGGQGVLSYQGNLLNVHVPVAWSTEQPKYFCGGNLE